MTSRRIVMVLAVGAILLGLAYSTAVWAAPGQSLDRQTIPTKTPVPEKEKNTPVPTATAQGTAMPGPTVAPTVGAGTPVSPQTLPGAGAAASIFPLVLIAAGLLLACAGWMTRHNSAR